MRRVIVRPSGVTFYAELSALSAPIFIRIQHPLRTTADLQKRCFLGRLVPHWTQSRGALDRADESVIQSVVITLVADDDNVIYSKYIKYLTYVTRRHTIA